eukprot:CAMPEP_0179032658 /NCGR_PEP_ID=MMETSP0796-20121207/11700_1 /TAXON_ID=73915 /ORGANISM="Pyrodinium bahamense, Strain pbaha01" /LENGTH=119 /DNA_ID=CAMNT_0020728889 /DNA_START=66 /DNA_END=422 /DNA_ORIENTATION=+
MSTGLQTSSPSNTSSLSSGSGEQATDLDAGPESGGPHIAAPIALRATAGRSTACTGTVEHVFNCLVQPYLIGLCLSSLPLCVALSASRASDVVPCRRGQPASRMAGKLSGPDRGFSGRR